jgi:hypothetical protein
MRVGGRYAMTMIIAGGRWSGTGSWLVLVLGCASRVALSLIDCLDGISSSQPGRSAGLVPVSATSFLSD